MFRKLYVTICRHCKKTVILRDFSCQSIGNRLNETGLPLRGVHRNVDGGKASGMWVMARTLWLRLSTSEWATWRHIVPPHGLTCCIRLRGMCCTTTKTTSFDMTILDSFACLVSGLGVPLTPRSVTSLFPFRVRLQSDESEYSGNNLPPGWVPRTDGDGRTCE